MPAAIVRGGFRPAKAACAEGECSHWVCSPEQKTAKAQIVARGRGSGSGALDGEFPLRVWQPVRHPVEIRR